MNWNFLDWVGDAGIGNSITLLGIAVSIALFVFRVRAQVDARRERINYANSDLISAVIKRLSLDRKTFESQDFEAFRKARAHQSNLNPNAIISFDLALSCAFKEIMNNPYLNLEERESVYDRVKASRVAGFAASAADDSVEKARDLAPIFVVAAAISLVAGISVSILASIVANAPVVSSESVVGWVAAITSVVAIISALVSVAGPFATRRKDQAFGPTLDVSFLRDLDRNSDTRHF
ncbi:MAG: hypothetical protein WA047_14390 [Phenylobacterium sp.]|uniref:hypothetical protein n=1 Tax=Phenylobacterium sp. TaxID=1871053 RepID=UPI003BB6107E